MQQANPSSATGASWGLDVLRFRVQDRPERPRFAFLLANWEYLGDARLDNPNNDIDAVEQALKDLDFQIARYDNLNTKSTFLYFGKFVEAARAAAVADKSKGCDVLIYYSGHGVQLAQNSLIRNYIVPVSFDPDDRENSTIADLVCVQEVLKFLDFATYRFVFLDACRDDGGFAGGGIVVRAEQVPPTPATTAGLDAAPSEPSRSFNPIKQRLRRSGIASNTLLAYATDPGDVASDGTGDKSPFTAAVCRHIGDFNLDVMDLMQSVSQAVRSETGKGGRPQIPWVNSNITDTYYFRNVGRRPIHALGLLGLLAGIFTALISFDIFESSQPFFIGKPQFVDVSENYFALVTSAGMGLVLAFGVWYWGAREAWKAIVTGLLYFATAVVLRLWFASNNPMTLALSKDAAEKVLTKSTPGQVGALEHAELIIYIALGTALGGAASIAAGYFFVPALRNVPRLMTAATIAAVAASSMYVFHHYFDPANLLTTGMLGGVLTFLGCYFLLPKIKSWVLASLTILAVGIGVLLQQFVNSGTNGDDGVQAAAHGLLVLLLVGAWHAALGINLGYAFMRYKPGSDERWIGKRYLQGMLKR